MTSYLDHALALDVGGTSLKSAIVSSEGVLMEGSFGSFPIDSKGTREEILDTFVRALSEPLHRACHSGISIQGISIGMPGPFEYKNGISRIKGVDKYESIYGLNLRDIFRDRLDLPGSFPILFESDAWVFVRGEAWLGAAQGYNRIIGLTLGTGLGSGFMVDDEMVDQGQGVPPLAWIGGLPYGSSIVDDYLSKRGMLALFQTYTGIPPSSVEVREIAERARTGEENARRVFEKTGKLLGQILKPVAGSFEAECIVIGGQISRSYDLFSQALQGELLGIPNLKTVTQAKSIDNSALLGATRFLFKRIGREST